MAYKPIKYPAMSDARYKMLHEPGHIYVAHSRYCDWVKVGFSTKISDRLESINRQYADFAPFSSMGTVRSTWSAEQQLHRFAAPFRAGHTGRSKELYPSTPELLKLLRAILTYREWVRLPFDDYRKARDYYRWVATRPTVAVEAEIAFGRYFDERRRTCSMVGGAA